MDSKIFGYGSGSGNLAPKSFPGTANNLKGFDNNF
jgi:hypothetical protein